MVTATVTVLAFVPTAEYLPDLVTQAMNADG
jgi:hypothetical protein